MADVTNLLLVGRIKGRNSFKNIEKSIKLYIG